MLAAARQLGYLALLPFVGGAVAVWSVAAAMQPVASIALSTYAAVVASFIGGIHWGFGFRQPAPAASLFAWGVVPSLVAWFAVNLRPGAGLAVHAALLALCFAVDRAVYPRQGAAAWLPLRLHLTLVASLGCLGGALAQSLR